MRVPEAAPSPALEDVFTLYDTPNLLKFAGDFPSDGPFPDRFLFPDRL